jgi:predicted ferric reductase
MVAGMEKVELPEGGTATSTAQYEPVLVNEELPRRHRVGLLAVAGLATVAAAGWFWWQGTPPGIRTLPANRVAAAGQFAGILGGVALLVQVLLVARVPWLERTVGTEDLRRAHTVFGFGVVYLLGLHAIFATKVDLPPGAPAWPGAWAVQVAITDVSTATLGYLILVVVTALSLPRIRTWLPFEWWRFVHLFAYLGIALAFVHQLTLGRHFLHRPTAAAVWTILHVAVLVSVLWWRLGRAVRLNMRHQLRVAGVSEEAPGVVSIYLSGRHLDKLPIQAGQHVRLRFVTPAGWWQSHPFSLSAAPNSRFLRITVKHLGDHTRYLQHLQPGVYVTFGGPYGGLTADVRRRHKVLLVAAGIGITPMRALFASLPAHRGDVTLLYRASSADDLVFRHELNEIARRRRARVHYLVGPRREYPQGGPLGTANLLLTVPDLADHDVYLCGPEDMLRATMDNLTRAGVPKRQIHTERFGF